MIIEQTHFDGDRFIQQRWAYGVFGYSRTVKIGNIVSFVCPVNVRKGDMVMCSDQAVNFCIELPDYDILAGRLFQRLFISNIAQIIASPDFLKCDVEVSRMDIVVSKEHKQAGIIQPDGLVSMNLASVKNGATLLYVGLHNQAGEGAHPRAFSLGFDANKITELMEKVNSSFYFLANDVFISTCNIT